MSSPLISQNMYAVVLAGGFGRRLWPLSRDNMPKQLLSLGEARTLLQKTVVRLLKKLPAERILTVTHHSLRHEVASQLEAINAKLMEGVISEPESRNTLAAISWATALVARNDPEAVVSVFSADHAIADEEAFHRAWDKSRRAVDDFDVVLMGITPTFPATSYGYVEFETVGDAEVFKVASFREKPDAETAARFFSSGRYLWNAGIFIFRASRYLEVLRRHQNDVFETVSDLADAGRRADRSVFLGLPNVSVDCALMEKLDRIGVVPAAMGWADLGNWESFYHYKEKNAEGNAVMGEVVAMKSRDNFLWSDDRLLAVYGVDDIVAVQTDDATLIAPRGMSAELTDLFAEIRARRPEIIQSHTTANRPWGSYTVLEDRPGYKVKRINVKPGGRLSLQKHAKRSEHWIVVSGTATVRRGEEIFELSRNEAAFILPEEIHQIENNGTEPLVIVEVQVGAYLGEDDIVRLKDPYDRDV